MTKKRRTRITLAALLVISMCAIFGMNVFATDTQEDYSINLLGEEQETKEDDLTAGTTDANEETATEPIAGEETQETDLSDMDTALGYVDEYNTNVTEDESFETHLKTAVETIRSDVKVYGTIISLLPPIIAIVLALITKEVYFSLFTGIISGALLYCGFAPFDTIKLTFEVIISKLTDGWNVGILIFLVILGIIVSLTNKAGGSAAYADWASKKISSKRGASLATFLLGIMIFVDDYFNCLTVGSVMRPVTDRQKMSRAKLAYIIDATAAPVCIIAPISSWAAAVTSVAPEGQGLSLFVRAIPYNFYALLTIVMIIVISVLKFDYGPMKKHEMNADNGDLFTSGKMEETPQEKGKKAYVIDLILPVIVLIISCVAGMIQTGGFFDKSSDNFLNFVYSFSDADASVGLVFGSFIALAFTVIFYLIRRVLNLKEISASLTEGFKAMVPAIMILTFAWTLSGITMALGAKIFVAEFVRLNVANLTWLLPGIVFLIALGLAFATGTSWGTFGILLPIVCAVFVPGDELMIISISACLAGAVCGDHCSPISDTTIMASAGANCNHINHVSTQLPYALTVAGVSFVSFILAGLIRQWFIVLPIAIVFMVGTLVVIKKITADKKKA